MISSSTVLDFPLIGTISKLDSDIISNHVTFLNAKILEFDGISVVGGRAEDVLFVHASSIAMLVMYQLYQAVLDYQPHNSVYVGSEFLR